MHRSLIAAPKAAIAIDLAQGGARDAGLAFLMIAYWCKFFDANGHIDGAEKISAADDAAVMTRAREIYDRRIGDGYEIWDGARLVHRTIFSQRKYGS